MENMTEYQSENLNQPNFNKVSRIFPILGLILSIIGLCFSTSLTMGFYNYHMLGVEQDSCKISEKANCNVVFQTEFSYVTIPLFAMNYEDIKDDIYKQIDCNKDRNTRKTCDFITGSYKAGYKSITGQEYNEENIDENKSIIPTSVWGMITYIILILFFIWSIATKIKYRAATILGPFLISVLSLGLSLYLAYVSITEIQKFCPFCLVMYCCNLLLFITLLIAMIKAGKTGIIGPFLGPWYFKNSDAYQVYIVPVIIFVFVAFFAGPMHSIIYKSYGEKFIPLELSLITYDTELTDVPSIGNNELGIEVVVYSDFMCPFCRNFAEDIHKILAHYDNKIEIFYKFLPLDDNCHPQATLHYGACEYAYGAYAAYKQGKFWEFHDIAYSGAKDVSNQLKIWFDEDNTRNPHDFPGIEEQIFNIARRLNLDMEQFGQDYNSYEARNTVMEHIEESINNEFTGTPTVLINGHKIVSGRKNKQNLINLIDKILNNQSLPFQSTDIQQEAEYDISLSNAPSFGTGELPVEIIMFSDYNSIYSREMANILNDILDQYDNKIKLYYKALPMDRECNPLLQGKEKDYHYGSCDYAFASLAAANQDRFWEFHDMIFEEIPEVNQRFYDWINEDQTRDPYDFSGYKEHILSIAERIIPDMDMFISDCESEDTWLLASIDIVEAIENNIFNAPAVIINGKKVSAGEKNMDDMVHIISTILNNENSNADTSNVN